MDPPSLTIGTVLGKYRITRAMGEGGMAEVYEAEHEKLGHKVAIKLLRPGYAFNADLLARFEREGRALAKLRTRNAVRVLDVDTTPNGTPYLVMELLAGRDFDEELRVRGPLPVAEVIRYVRDAANALGEAHALGLVHRDVKPSNLFLADEDDGRIVKVIDFGIAKDDDASDVRLTRTEAVMGTPLYMAPEQFRRSRDVDARADVWALGATLYELLTGSPPFTGTATTIGVTIVTEEAPPIPESRTDIGPELREIVTRCLQKEPAKRFPDGRALARALSALSSSDAGASGGREAVVVAPASSSAISLHHSDAHLAATQVAVTDVPARTVVDPPRAFGRSGRVALVASVAGVAVLALLLVGVALRPKATLEPTVAGSTTALAAEAPRVRATEATAATTSAAAGVSSSPAPAALPSAAPSASVKRPSSATSARPGAHAPTAQPSQSPLFFPGQ